MLSCVSFFVTPWTVAHQAPLSMEFSREEYWSGQPFPAQGIFLRSESQGKPTTLMSKVMPMAWSPFIKIVFVSAHFCLYTVIYILCIYMPRETAAVLTNFHALFWGKFFLRVKILFSLTFYNLNV